MTLRHATCGRAISLLPSKIPFCCARTFEAVYEIQEVNDYNELKFWKRTRETERKTGSIKGGLLQLRAKERGGDTAAGSREERNERHIERDMFQ